MAVAVVVVEEDAIGTDVTGIDDADVGFSDDDDDEDDDVVVDERVDIFEIIGVVLLLGCDNL